MMKKELFLVAFLALIFSGIQGQIVIQFGFTAELNGVHKALDSIYIANLTRGTDTMLYGNDTVLTVYSSIGVHDGTDQPPSELILYPNFPNPFSYSTIVWFYLPENNSVLLRIFNIAGVEVAVHRQYLLRGHHHFRFMSGNEPIYILSVETNFQRKSRKLINLSSQSGRAGIEYTGHHSDRTEMRIDGISKSEFLWYPGDKMRFVGFAGISLSLIGHDVLERNPYLSENYCFDIIAGLPCVDEPFISDIDGNKYRTTQIGRQCWMRENLKVTKYNDGTSIPWVTDNPAWVNLSTGALCYYGNDSISHHKVYGALYNWFVINSGNLCPAGWHVPEDIEWTIMTDHLGGSNVAGEKLKESGFDHWNPPNYATNASGFTALPGGYRNVDGNYLFINENGGWWTSTAHSQSNSIYRLMGNTYSGVTSYNGGNTFGLSVRCIRDSVILLPTVHTNSITSITSVSAISGGHISDDGGGEVLSRGVCWSTTSNPTVQNNHTNDGNTTGTFTSNITGLLPGTTYYLRAYATNAAGTAYGQELIFQTAIAPPCPGSPTIIDFNGNVYNTVLIGTQCWLKENLRARNYNDGTPIGTEMSWYDNNMAAYDSIYGALYKWNAVNTGILCPPGWHVPNDTDWTTLTNYLGGENVAGGLMKDTGVTYWNSPNSAATNSSGFTALPGGYRSNTDGNFYTMGTDAYFWTSTLLSHPHIWSRRLFSGYSHVLRATTDRNEGLSVRCIRSY